MSILSESEKQAYERGKADGKRERDAELREVFSWLLGYTDFKERADGDGAYWWRKELRERLKALGLTPNDNQENV